MVKYSSVYAYAERGEMAQKSLYSPNCKTINRPDQRKDEILTLKSSLNLAHYEARLPLQSERVEKKLKKYSVEKLSNFEPTRQVSSELTEETEMESETSSSSTFDRQDHNNTLVRNFTYLRNCGLQEIYIFNGLDKAHILVPDVLVFSWRLEQKMGWSNFEKNRP